MGILLLSKATFSENIMEMEMHNGEMEGNEEVGMLMQEVYFLTGRWSNTRAACLKGLCKLHPWRSSILDWVT